MEHLKRHLPVSIYRPTYPTLVTNDWRTIPLIAELRDYFAQIEGLNGNTWLAKTHSLKAFFSWAEARLDVPLLGDLTPGFLNAFKDFLLESGRKPATVAVRVGCLKAFGEFLSEKYDIPNPARLLREPRAKLGAPKALSPEEQQRLRDTTRAHRGDSFVAARTYMLVELLFETGFRISEALCLRECQISEDRRTFIGVWGKGGKWSDKPISAALQQALEWWLPIRRNYLAAVFQHRWNDAEVLFPNYPLLPTNSKPVREDPSTWQAYPKSATRWLKTACAIAGVREVGPHALRHSFAYNLIEATKDVALVCEALNHADPSITMRYAQRGTDRIRDALNAMNDRRHTNG